jgi:hypothetical protein
MNESELQREVIDLCKKYRLPYYHCVDSTRNLGNPGWPDLAICGKRLIFAELKSNYGNLTGTQTNWRYRLIAAGQSHYIWRPSDLESGEIEQVLSEIAL